MNCVHRNNWRFLESIFKNFRRYSHSKYSINYVFITLLVKVTHKNIISWKKILEYIIPFILSSFKIWYNTAFKLPEKISEVKLKNKLFFLTFVSAFSKFQYCSFWTTKKILRSRLDDTWMIVVFKVLKTLKVFYSMNTVKAPFSFAKNSYWISRLFYLKCFRY